MKKKILSKNPKKDLTIGKECDILIKLTARDAESETDFEN